MFLCLIIQTPNFLFVYRKLEQEYSQKLTSVRAELTKERDIIHQQATQQHEELEGEIEKIKQEATLLRDRLALGAKVKRMCFS